MKFTGQDTRYGERYLKCENCGHEQVDKTARRVPEIKCNQCREATDDQ